MVERVLSAMFLGVTFDEHLNWVDHILSLRSEMAKATGILCRVRNIFPASVKRMLYYSLIYSKMYYCLLIRGTAAESHIHSLLAVQKKAVRAIGNVSSTTSSCTLFSKYLILTVHKLFVYKLLVMIYNGLKNSSQYFFLLFGLQNYSVPYSLRHVPELCVPKGRTNYGQQRTGYLISKYYSKYHLEIENAQSLSTFKTYMRDSLL